MPERRQTPGMSYRILRRSAEEALIEYRYICPYCMRKSAVSSAAYPSDYERLETGGFYEALACSECGETAYVRFWRAMRID